MTQQPVVTCDARGAYHRDPGGRAPQHRQTAACVNPIPANWSDADDPNPETVLDEAQRLVNGPKQTDYGPPELNFKRLADLWNAYIQNRTDPSAPIQSWEVADLFILHKLARNQQSQIRDTYVDIIGYAYCGARCAGIAT